ncbi:hypothetical protein BJ322DRAFT_507524 [Thelephora terrestris]|uniref:DUF6533 domain-containing protein n=1 Tax=Thelephora terrestris TaxID=56493 RepID=A0A9P6H3Q9_9AGAM|nr:hypothetical protein BJ322DRAFT_507524 [Thelephora terrestris]
MTDSPETALYFIFISQLVFVAFYAIVAWDWITSFNREWRYIWKAAWTPVKVSYLFCRYWVLAVGCFLLFCFVNDHTLEMCHKIYKIPVALAMWNQLGSEVVLLIRTYAFFNRNVYLLSFLIACLGGIVAYQLYVATSQMELLPFIKPPYTHGPCLPVSRPHAAHLLGFFMAPLAYDTIVTVITVVKAFMIRRRRGGPSSMLIQTFIREGVFYYILISIANLVNGIFYLQPRQAMSAICIPLSVFLSPVLACRLILDLRERGAEASRADTGRSSTNNGLQSLPRCYQGSTSFTSTHSSPRSPQSTGGGGIRSSNRGSTRSKGQFLVSTSVSGVATAITMGKGVIDGVELAEMSKEDVDHFGDDDFKIDVGGVGGIRVEVEKTSTNL